MRPIILISILTFMGLFLSPLAIIGQTAGFSKLFGALLAEHQTQTGVDYASITTAELSAIDNQLPKITSLDSKKGSLSIGTCINIYNYLIIREIHKEYPLESVGELSTFFKKEILLGTERTSLDKLESEILELGNDPFIHLLLNCSAKGCPPLQFIDADTSLDFYIKKALTSNNIYRQKDDQLYLSQIFFWYADDFKSRELLTKRLSAITGDPDLGNKEIKYLAYDWSLNDIRSAQGTYYPTRLYAKGGGELKIFNNYYTQNESGERYDFFSSFFQLLIGTNRRFNYGMDIKLRSVSQGKLPMFSALKFQNVSIQTAPENQNFARVGISGIGPKIKYQPFKKHNNINFLHTLYFVPMSDAEGNDEYGYADYNHVQLFNQMYYEKEFSVKRRLFVDAAINVENIKFGVRRKEEHFMPIQIPITAIYSYFPTTKSTIYGIGSLGQRLDVKFAKDTNTYYNYSVYGQLGLGLKYFLTDFLEAEILYTNFLDTTPGRTAHTINMGLRFFKF